MSSLTPLAPGSWLGLFGGGQLGRMFCMAAQSMGYRVCVVDPSPDSPAGSVADRHLLADYLDAAALDELARSCAAVTTEFENVPAQALQSLAAHVRVAPDARGVSVAQDRIVEKQFIRDCGIDTAPYAVVRTAKDLDAIDASLFPGILKVARLGYDGKGQARVATPDEARSAFARFADESDGEVPCVLEKMLDLALEVSVIVARGFDGAMVHYPVGENLHRNGILARTIAPARVDAALADQAIAHAKRIAQSLGYVGVLCVEFFVVRDGDGPDGAHQRLVVNEMAPRPHNSGHYTIDAAVTSQFEQQARVLAALPLGSTELMRPSVMLNILGDAWRAGEPDWSSVLAADGTKLHLYGKKDAREGRKMGHLTIVAADGAQALDTASRLAPLIGQSG